MTGKKKLLIICGTGVATSTVVMGKVKSWLDKNGLRNRVELRQGKVAEEISHLDDYDIVVSTTVVPDAVRERVINGVPLLIGVGVEDVYSELKSQITTS